MTESGMTTEDLVDYACELLASFDGDDAGLAELEETYPVAVEIARMVTDGFITVDGVTDRGAEHLYDLWNDFENGE